jgi:hypothetical protein
MGRKYVQIVDGLIRLVAYALSHKYAVLRSVVSARVAGRIKY